MANSSSSTDTASPTSRNPPCRGIRSLLGAAGLIWALFIYRPWIRKPFDIYDFSEFLPLLKPSRSFLESFAALTHHYIGQGRLNLIPYAITAAKWELFGANTMAWQLSRFALMCWVVGAAFVLFRRLGASCGPAAMGSGLFIVSPIAAPTWVNLTAGEPLGLGWALAAALLASYYQETTRHWRAVGAGVGTLCAGLLMSKELLGYMLPLILAVACCRQADGSLAAPRVTPRNTWVTAVVLAVTTTIATAVFITAASAEPGSYVSYYGAGSPSLIRFVAVMYLVAVPLWPGRRDHQLYYVAVASAYQLLVLVGLYMTVRGGRRRFHPIPLLAIGLAPVSLGALVHIPLPWFQSFYGLPMLLGTTTLFCLALTTIETRAPNLAWAAYGLCAILLLQASLESRRLDAYTGALNSVNEELAQALHDYRDASTIVVASDPSMAGGGQGLTLRRYSLATGGEALPPASDVACSSRGKMADEMHAHTLLISYIPGCGSLPRTTRVVRRYYQFREWPSLRVRMDSVRAEMLYQAQRAIAGPLPRYRTPYRTDSGALESRADRS
jgi:hypothetical protein